MPHLIPPMQGITLVEAYRRLTEAHDWIVRKAGITGCETIGWGCRNVRDGHSTLRPPNGSDYISLTAQPNETRPPDVGQDLEHRAECVQQMAHVERLIAAMEWAIRDPSLAESTVKQCNAMQSADLDLWLVTDGGEHALFEVSDKKEGSTPKKSKAKWSKKEEDDLASLMLIAERLREDGKHVRAFVGVSPEMAAGYMRLLSARYRETEKYSLLFEVI
jgi:hypothetical protein